MMKKIILFFIILFIPVIGQSFNASTNLIDSSSIHRKTAHTKAIKHKPKKKETIDATDYSSTADIIIFSFDRAMQLDLFLRSIFRFITSYGNIIVIYRTSNSAFEKSYQDLRTTFPSVIVSKQTGATAQKITDSFKPLLITALTTLSKSNYVLFGVDDIVITDYVDFKDCIETLNKTDAYQFNLRMGKNITQCGTCPCDAPFIAQPPLTEIKPGVFKWRFCQGTHDWCFPNSVDMVMVRKNDVHPLFSQLNFNTPGKLEGAWDQVKNLLKFGLCYEKSKMLNLPLNTVQHDGKNASMDIFSSSILLSLFNDGLRMDIEDVLKINVIAPHLHIREDYQPNFVHKDTITKTGRKNRHQDLWATLKDFTPPFEKEIVVVIPSYCNKKWYEKNLDSVLMQKYGAYTVLYIDDVSPDNTADLVDNYIKENKLEQKITLIRNSQRCGGLANIYNAVQLCPDNVIVVTLDGDDWFYDENVLSLLNKVYHLYDVWMTYGCDIQWPTNKLTSCAQVPETVVEKRSFRTAPFTSGHLRTFYAWLFKQIKKEDLMHNGQFMGVSWDQAMMLAMLEMSGKKSMFIPDITYVYNVATPLNDFKIRANLQKQMCKIICAQKPYARIEQSPLAIQ